MKKLLSILFVSILLTGCGNNVKEETKVKKKSCRVEDEESSFIIIMDVEGEKNKVKSVDFILEMPGAKELFDTDEDVPREDMKELEEELRKSLSDEIVPGTKAAFKVGNDKSICKSIIKIADANEESLDYIDYDEDYTFDDYVKILEEQGFICK